VWFSSNTIVKFADDTVVVGLISSNDEKAYLEEVANLSLQDNRLWNLGHNNIRGFTHHCELMGLLWREWKSGKWKWRKWRWK